MRTLNAGALGVAALLLGACSGSGSNGLGGIGPTDPTYGNGNPAPGGVSSAPFHPYFQVAQGLLPYPTDLFLNGSVDGTINQPLLAVEPNAVSVNALDGFGVNGEITVRFTEAIDPTTLGAPGAITVLETQMLTLTTGTSVARVPVGVRRALIPGVDYSAALSTAVDALGQVLSITPLKPLTASSGGVTFNPASPPAGLPLGSLDAGGVGYLVILTSAIKATDGTAAAPDNDYGAIVAAVAPALTPQNPAAGCVTLTNAALRPVCGALAPQLLIAAGAGIPLNAVTLTFSFTSQSTRDTLVQMATTIHASASTAPIAVQALPNGHGGILTTKNLLDPTNSNPFLTGNADVYEGTITIPYYLPTPADATAANPAPPLTGQWLSANAVSLVAGQAGSNYITRYNPVPAVTHTLTIPLLMTFPNAIPKPAGGWPVAIFVHGVTRNRADALAIAEGYASAGFAVAAIDLPLHGITPTDPAAGLRIPGVAERTFDVDYINNATDQPPADGVIDTSGSNYIQVASPVTSRDNSRQAVVDELALAKALPLAHVFKLGTLVSPAIDPSRIALSGQSLGSIIGTMVASLPSDIQSFGLSVPGGGIVDLLLQSPTFGPPIGGGVAAKLGNNTLLYHVFFRDAQAAIDSADPVNHAAWAAQNKPLLIHKVIGDQVIPNSATDRLLKAAGIFGNKANAAGPWPSNYYVAFTAGTHGSLLAPGNTPTVTVEMQREIVGFGFAGGAGFQITDATYVQP
jgi:hypothetical protein